MDTDSPASSRYELCDPASPRQWGLKTIASLLVGGILQTDPGYYGGFRWRIRDRETGEYVYEVRTSQGGLDAREAQRSLTRDLASMSVEEFEKEYSINSR